MFDYNEMSKQFGERNIPVGIEEVCQTVGWKAPIDSGGDWIKVNASAADGEPFVELDRINDTHTSTWMFNE